MDSRGGHRSAQNQRRRPGLPGLQPYIDAFRAAGIRFIGWGYIYLKWNALAEAKGTKEAINLYKPECT